MRSKRPRDCQSAALAADSFPAEALPAEALPEEALPEEALPEEALPAEASMTERSATASGSWLSWTNSRVPAESPAPNLATGPLRLASGVLGVNCKVLLGDIKQVVRSF